MSEPSDRRPDVAALDRLIDVGLAEFSALRAEIAARARSQEQYMTLGLTAATTVGGLVVTHTATRPLLLVVVVVGPLLGLLFFDHATTVDELGDHIRQTIAPSVRGAVSELAGGEGTMSKSDLAKLLAWEDEVLRSRRKAGWRGIVLGPSLLPFVIIPAVAALFARDTHHAISPTAFWVLRTVGVGFIVLYFILWFRWVRKYRKSHLPQPTSAAER
jgi:hypothetical protein